MLEGFSSKDAFGVEVIDPSDFRNFTAGQKVLADRTGYQSVRFKFVVPDGLRVLRVRIRRFGGEPGGPPGTMWDVHLTRVE